ncbi:glutathione S-transferase kappa 1-like [Rana temporaria]|uniref:glutathione S-transferase kappa 1-like n=1 Tax=Rana temporaria TaxID=8407 RepID=UPI001AAC475E|nr:glutathione S-transferase kappa 1-like [Rana temporaria]
MSKRRVLELFYDVVSPYSWLGFEVMSRYKNIWNVDVQFRPGLLGGIMQGTGNSAPAMVPKKGAYMNEDLARVAEFYEVPLKAPSDFFHVIIKKGSLSAMRFVTAVQMMHPEFLEPVSRELWVRIWSEDKDITEPESILEAAKKAGMSEDIVKKVLASISTPEIKNKLKENTDSALKYGVFGMPSIVAHINGKPQLYFGSDRFELLAHNLGEKWYGPVPQKSRL